jgi:hypothetical protein
VVNKLWHYLTEEDSDQAEVDSTEGDSLHVKKQNIASTITFGFLKYD